MTSIVLGLWRMKIVLRWPLLSLLTLSVLSAYPTSGHWGGGTQVFICFRTDTGDLQSILSQWPPGSADMRGSRDPSSTNRHKNSIFFPWLPYPFLIITFEWLVEMSLLLFFLKEKICFTANRRKLITSLWPSRLVFVVSVSKY